MSECLLAHRRRVFGGLHQTGHHIRRSPAGPRLLPLQQTRALRAGARLPGPRVRVASATEAAKQNVHRLNTRLHERSLIFTYRNILFLSPFFNIFFKYLQTF